MDLKTDCIAFSPMTNNKRRRNEELVYSLSYINCIKPMPFRNNPNNLPRDAYMEEKSLVDIISKHKTQNPYEVLRKPPKKKRKKVDDNCFVNEALNLNTPEDKFNPFEVKRLPKELTDNFEKENHSFVNLALNLKIPDTGCPQNPFEIMRTKPVDDDGDEDENEDLEHDQKEPSQEGGYENQALDVKIPMAIAVPFTPTINHRIDFGPMKSPETPSEMLSKKLVFSPQQANCATPKRLFCKSLSTISEEPIDIDEELDCYQLELENSINEAKLNNRKYFSDFRRSVTRKQAMKITPTEFKIPKEAREFFEEQKPQETELVDNEANDDEEEDSFDDDLRINDGNYQPFKRAYRRPTESQPTKETMPPPSLKTNEIKTNKIGSSGGLKGMIRRSIRKMTTVKPKKGSMESLEEKTEKGGSSIMSSIRHSLRKRKREYPASVDMEISIISDVERKVFKEESTQKLIQSKGEQQTQKENTNPFLTATRYSIRRGVRNNLNVFHKADDYAL